MTEFDPNGTPAHAPGEAIDGPIDPATGLMHAAQVAWNALARLELMLRDRDGGEAP